ncbi:pyridoxal 5'-phosphate synthase glutaminase subunit PdxT [uncultured Deinococcus sp.]|uniref:pyridoxal 5'-phosphate synthase glutaminase subunit PdxT n=2 Tax=Deinococcus TaxID=1298 RepID=UPI0025827403|nr:pyridoxal 5'-phosphate synthase glutaminase subunit PdxT [uncultured Deinococcus sp.]
MPAAEVGVLALQGAYREHAARLRGLGASVREVRLPRDLAGLAGLVLPGGESTTMVRLMDEYALWAPLRDFHARGGALWGTCAGAILLAAEVTGASPAAPAQRSLGLIDVTVQRNAFGRQLDSFTTPLEVAGLDTPFPAVFIRAPVITHAGPGVEVLARHGGEAVLARQGRVMASSFHPELTPDARLHELFLGLLEQRAPRVGGGAESAPARPPTLPGSASR